MTSVSIPSWTSAPAAGGRRPRPARIIAANDIPIPTTTLCRAMAPARLAMAMASESRSRRSTVSTTSAASDEAVPPLAPMATPTSARASAGASLMPSPTMIVGPAARSATTMSTLSAGLHSASAESTPSTTPTLSATSARSPDTITTRGDAGAPQLADGACGVRADRVVEQEGPCGLTVDGHEHRERPIELGAATDRCGPPGIDALRHPCGLADGDRVSRDQAAHPTPWHLLDADGDRQREVVRAGRPDDRGGHDVGRDLVE